MRRTSMFVGALSLALFTACGGGKKNEPPPAQPEAAKEEAKAEAPPPADKPVEEAKAEPAPPPPPAKKLYMDVHELGKVKAKDVAEAHKKDLATQGKHGVEFIAYWVDEKHGKVYCLSEGPSAEATTAVHKEAHGLIPKTVVEVTADNKDWKPSGGKAKLFMDVHKLGAGKVTPEALAEAHKKDQAVEGKHKVKYLNYWLDAESGTVMCLAEAPNAAAAVKVHKEAHGLLADSIDQVTEGR